MKFKNHIEVQAGIKDSGNSIGSEGQILSSTGEVDQKVEWINQSAITASSDFIYYEVKNETGSTILKGKGVMAVGTDGNSGHILVDEMVADGTIIPRYFLGVLETDIENGGFARAIAFGELDQFNTNGQNGETWANGQVLWCDPDSPGDFTITEPLGPNVKIPAAFILKASTQGKIQIRVQANEGVKDLYDTKIDSQVDGDVLVWDNTTGVWFNDSTLNVDYTAGKVGIGTVTPQEKLHIYSTGAGAVRAEIESTQATDALLKYTNSIGSYATFLTQSGQFSIYDYNALSHRFYMLTNGNIGINTTTPSSKLHSVTTASGPIDYTQRAAILGVNDSTDITYANSVGVAGQVRTSGGYAIYGDAYGAGGWAGYFDGKGYFSNNVGIGTTSPNTALEVDGAISTTTSDYAQGSTGSRLLLETSGSGNTHSYIQAQSSGGASNAEDLALQLYGGKVGIGTSSPTALLTLESSSFDPYPGIDIKSTSTYPGSKIRFLDSSGSEVSTIESFSNPALLYLQLNYGSIASYSSTLTLGGGFLHLSTAGSERMRITNTGNVGIGTTDPNAKLEVVGTTGVIVDSGSSSQAVLTLKGDASSYGGGGVINIIGGSQDYVYYATNIKRSPDTFEAKEEYAMFLHTWSWDGNMGNTAFQPYTSYDFKSQGSSQMVIYNNNVGIGTTSPSYKLDVLGDGRFTNGTHGTVHLGNYGQNISSNYGYIQTSNSLRVNGSVKVSNDTNTPSSSNVGSIRYRTSGNNSYVDMCMQTGGTSYAWVNIVTNNW